jgi:VanZ family protein
MLDDPVLNKHTKIVFLLCLAYLAFVVYGSLVPLNFQPIPLSAAWQRFKAVPFLSLGVDSLADWVANLLLFIPLAFFLTGVGEGSGRFRKVVFTIVTVVFCIFLSGAIEFTQIFFPPRTVSQNDIFAESLGSLIGVVSWWIFGPSLVRWFSDWQAHRSAAGIYERLLWGYLLLVFLYSIFPLDLTISPVEIYHKCKEGRLIIVPYLMTGFHAKQIYELLTGIAMFTPIALLLVASGKKSAKGAWICTIAFAVTIEVAQLFVYSRTTATTDVLFACLGGYLGSVLGQRIFKVKKTAEEAKPGNDRIWIGIIMYLVSGVLALVLFWYPFNFVTDREFLLHRLDFFRHVPFSTYYYVSEFQAVDYLIRRLVVFSFIGASLAILVKSLRKPPLYSRALVLGLTCLVAVVVESGRIALPTKVPDSIDIIVEITGAWVGYKLTCFLMRRLRDARPVRSGR